MRNFDMFRDSAVAHYGRHGARIVRMIANFDYVLHWGEAKWSDSRNGYVYPGYGRGSVAIDEDMKIHINHMAGSYPTMQEIAYVIMGHKDGYVAVKKALEFRRKNPYRIECRVGMSGAYDFKLVSATKYGDKYVREIKSRIHISMYDKFNAYDVRIGIFLPDLITMLCSYDGWFAERLEAIKTTKFGSHKVCKLTRRLASRNGMHIEYRQGSTLTEADIRDKGQGWIVD